MTSDPIVASDENPGDSSRRTVIKVIFWLAIAVSAFLIYVAVFKSDSIIPLYVIVFSLIGGLMYLFASITIEWAEAKKALQDNHTAVEAFNKKNWHC